ncbi:MAG: hypothetical protein ACLQFI_15800 [Methylocella sp.]|jgi:hypothetical protein
MQREPVGVRIVWIVDRPEFNAWVYERGNEDTLTEKTVGLGDHQPGLVFPAGGKGALQLRPVVSLARLGFRKLSNFAPVASIQI